MQTLDEVVGGRKRLWRFRPMSAQARRSNLDGYLFIAPWLIGLVVFYLGPMIASLVLSFTHYEILTPIEFIGLGNYREILTDDPLFWQSLRNTVLYVVTSVPIRVAIALGLAIALNQRYWGTRLFRTIFYLPSVTSGVAVATVWLWMFEPSFGVINSILRFFGLPGPPWLGSLEWAMPSVILMSLIYIGSMMVIFLAGLQGIPRHLYEAAELDGAGVWAKFRTVTFPMLSPIVFFNTVMAVIQSFQVFTNVYVMTHGGPANATMVYMLYLYNQAFQYLHMGYASALAWLLFIIILVITIIQFKSSKWVYYEGES